MVVVQLYKFNECHGACISSCTAHTELGNASVPAATSLVLGSDLLHKLCRGRTVVAQSCLDETYVCNRSVTRLGNHFFNHGPDRFCLRLTRCHFFVLNERHQKRAHERLTLPRLSSEFF